MPIKTYRVYATRTEMFVAYIDAASETEAEEIADENYSDFDWNEIDGSLDTTINFGEAEENV